MNPIGTILLDFDSYLAIWQDKIFQVYLLYFLLNYKNLRGKCKHFKITFLTQNVKVEFHWFLMVNPLRHWFWVWVCMTQKHSYLGPLPPSKTRRQNLVWVTLPALGHAVSTLDNYFLTWDSPAKTSSLYSDLNCKWHCFSFKTTKFLWLYISPLSLLRIIPGRGYIQDTGPTHTKKIPSPPKKMC